MVLIGHALIGLRRILHFGSRRARPCRPEQRLQRSSRHQRLLCLHNGRFHACRCRLRHGSRGSSCAQCFAGDFRLDFALEYRIRLNFRLDVSLDVSFGVHLRFRRSLGRLGSPRNRSFTNTALRYPQPLRQRFCHLRQFDRGFHHLAQPLQCRQIAFAEGMRFPGKKLEHAQHFFLVHHRHHHHRRDAQLPADFMIHPRVPLGVVAAQRPPRAHALARQSKLGGQQRPQFGRVRARAGAALHVISSAAAQRDGGSVRPRNILRAVRQQLQGGVQVALGHGRQGTSSVLRGETCCQLFAGSERRRKTGRRRPESKFWVHAFLRNPALGLAWLGAGHTRHGFATRFRFHGARASPESRSAGAHRLIGDS